MKFGSLPAVILILLAVFTVSYIATFFIGSQNGSSSAIVGSIGSLQTSLLSSMVCNEKVVVDESNATGCEGAVLSNGQTVPLNSYVILWAKYSTYAGSCY